MVMKERMIYSVFNYSVFYISLFYCGIFSAGEISAGRFSVAGKSGNGENVGFQHKTHQRPHQPITFPFTGPRRRCAWKWDLSAGPGRQQSGKTHTPPHVARVWQDRKSACHFWHADLFDIVSLCPFEWMKGSKVVQSTLISSSISSANDLNEYIFAPYNSANPDVLSNSQKEWVDI